MHVVGSVALSLERDSFPFSSLHITSSAEIFTNFSVFIGKKIVNHAGKFGRIQRRGPFILQLRRPTSGSCDHDYAGLPVLSCVQVPHCPRGAPKTGSMSPGPGQIVARRAPLQTAHFHGGRREVSRDDPGVEFTPWGTNCVVAYCSSCCSYFFHGSASECFIDYCMLDSQLKGALCRDGVFIGDPANVVALLEKMIAEGADGFQVVSDFDATLTRHHRDGKRCCSSYGQWRKNYIEEAFWVIQPYDMDDPSIDWSFHRSIDWLVAWLIDWLIDWLTVKYVLFLWLIGILDSNRLLPPWYREGVCSCLIFSFFGVSSVLWLCIFAGWKNSPEILPHRAGSQHVGRGEDTPQYEFEHSSSL